MQCGVCQEKPATVHLTQIAGEKAQTLHLCPHCAETKGVSNPDRGVVWDLVFAPDAPPSPIQAGAMDLSLLMNPLIHRKWLIKNLCNAAFVKKSRPPCI